MVSTLGNLLAFLGFCALVAGIISVIVPLRRLRIQSRGMGALTALAGAALLVIGAMLAPPSSVGETVQLTLSTGWMAPLSGSKATLTSRTVRTSATR